MKDGQDDSRSSIASGIYKSKRLCLDEKDNMKGLSDK
jgi:hypothetical protein